MAAPKSQETSIRRIRVQGKPESYPPGTVWVGGRVWLYRRQSGQPKLKSFREYTGMHVGVCVGYIYTNYVYKEVNMCSEQRYVSGLALITISRLYKLIHCILYSEIAIILYVWTCSGHAYNTEDMSGRVHLVGIAAQLQQWPHLGPVEEWPHPVEEWPHFWAIERADTPDQLSVWYMQ